MNLRDYARDKPCMVRLPGICNFNTATTVLAHERVNGLSGTGLKAPDIFAAWCCSACHDVVDGRVESELSYEARRLALSDGVRATQLCLLNAGLIIVRGERERPVEKIQKIVPRRTA